MKKVALIYSKRLSDPTGASSVMRILNDANDLFKKNNIDLTVYSRNNSYNSQIPTYSNKKNVVNLVKKLMLKWLRSMAQSNRLFASFFIYIGTIRPAKKIVAKYINSGNKDDIIFVHELYTCYEYIKQKKSDSKIVLVMHTNGESFKMTKIYFKSIEKSFILKHLLKVEKLTLANVDKIGFVAKQAYQNFIYLNPEFEINKAFYVNNGIPILNFNRIRNNMNESSISLKICCIGSVNERKGQRFIVEALNQLLVSKNLPQIRFHFLIIGDGDIKQELEELSRKNEIDNYITFYGRSNKIDQFLIDSDIFILPSKDEGMPIAILEAMRASLPIVSTRVGGIPDLVIEGETGIFIEPSINGVIDFLNKIGNYNWKEMGEKANKLFHKKFTVNAMINSYSNIMNQL